MRTFFNQSDGSMKFTDVAYEQVVRNGYAKSVMPLLFHGKVNEYYLCGIKKSVFFTIIMSWHRMKIGYRMELNTLIMYFIQPIPTLHSIKEIRYFMSIF